MRKIILSKKYKNDIILTASILIVAVALFIIITLFSKKGGYVTVVADGKTVGKYPLSINTVVEIRTENGYNLLVIENMKAYIKEASCPDKLCLHQGKVSKDGQALVCLPNKTTIIVKSDDKPEMDFKS